jgi:hypothetical protein
MLDFDALAEFPPDSNNRDYQLFEEFPNGSTVWRDRMFGLKHVESKLRDLARQSDNKFLALSMRDRDRVAVRPRSVKPISNRQRKSSA